MTDLASAQLALIENHSPCVLSDVPLELRSLSDDDHVPSGQIAVSPRY